MRLERAVPSDVIRVVLASRLDVLLECGLRTRGHGLIKVKEAQPWRAPPLARSTWRQDGKNFSYPPSNPICFMAGTSQTHSNHSWPRHQESWSLGKPLLPPPPTTPKQGNQRITLLHAARDSAGVTGLTTTLQLLRAGYNNVIVVAKHMPSDIDAEYASPLAAANWVP